MSKTKMAKVKTTGTYAARAKELADAFEKALNQTLGANYLYERRGQDPKYPIYHWELKDSVTAKIDKSSGADPKIWVFRSDPILQPPHEKDWKNKWFDRDYDSELYHVGMIAAYVKEQLEYNRSKIAEHKANREAFERGMQGTMIPTNVSVERNPKTGFYELYMTAKIKELSGEEVKFVVAKCRDFNQAVEPLEKKDGSDV